MISSISYSIFSELTVAITSFILLSNISFISLTTSSYFLLKNLSAAFSKSSKLNLTVAVAPTTH